ncbi:MAG: TrmB family transcriptional regulator [Promethearchaeota archaeon]
MKDQKNSEALEEFKRAINFKSVNIPDANWRLHALLRRLGLTKYEVQAYIALIQGGTQTVLEIVKKTGIPQPRAYDTLGNLVKYGLIEPKVESSKKTTRKFRPVDPNRGLENLFSFFSYAKDQAILELQKISSVHREFHSGIWEVQNKNNIITTAKSMIKKAEYEILIVASVSVFKELMKELILAVKRRVSISWVSSFEEDFDSEIILKWGAFLRIKQRKGFSMPYIIIDQTQALQWGTRTFDHDTDHEFVVAQVIEQKELIHTLIDHFFFSNWYLGKPTSIIFREPALPRTFVHIQNAIEEIEYLSQRNQIPRVKITGFRTESGKSVTVTGKISKINHQWTSGLFSISLLPDDSDEEVSIGGIRAQYEEITADNITLLNSP